MGEGHRVIREFGKRSPTDGGQNNGPWVPVPQSQALAVGMVDVIQAQRSQA